MSRTAFKQDLTLLTSLIASQKSADEIKKAYIEISKKYHPDLNASATPEDKQLFTECMRIINQVYERYETGNLPKPVLKTERKGQYKYTNYFGEEKTFPDFNEFLFSYAKDCYSAGNTLNGYEETFDDAITYFKECIKALEKWKPSGEDDSRIDLAKHFLDGAKEQIEETERRKEHFKTEIKNAAWGKTYLKNLDIPF